MTDESPSQQQDPCRVNLTLVDIASAVQEDDSKATKLCHWLDQDWFLASCPARKFLQEQPSTSEENALVRKQVLRFLQVKDKYLSLGSVLLKSQAFHKIHCQSPLPSTGFRTVIDLPRTKHNKPFIPTRGNCRDGKEEDAFPLSVSHQFPFVGVAQLPTPSRIPHIGMDIVVFDDYNRRLYSSEEEFLQVFQSSFTKREWALLAAEDECRLQEFYVRWSMKEAYTKALGLGMGVDFSSFDLAAPLEKDGDDLALWRGISVAKEGTKLSGTVTNVDGTKNATEQWGLYFLPVFASGIPDVARGCLCVCLGPFGDGSDIVEQFDITVDCTNLLSLIEWHGQRKG